MKRPFGGLLLALAAFGQRNTGEESDAVFRVTTSLVQVDAVVTDSKGRYIRDLTATDFVVLEDGRPQEITRFAYVETGNRAAPGAKRPQPVAAAAAPAAPLKRDEVRRTVVLMVDDLGLSFESMAYVRRALRKFIEEQMQRGDLVAICRTGAGSGALQQFTNDKRLLVAIADGLRWNPNGRYGSGIFEPIGKGPELDLIVGNHGGGGNLKGMLEGIALAQNGVPARNEEYTLGTLGAVNYIMGALREMPGRKSIVLFSDGLQVEGNDSESPRWAASRDRVDRAMKRLFDTAARAGAVIYTVHATGLQPLQFDAQDRLSRTQLAVAQTLQQSRREAFYTGQQWLSYLAEQTGGLPFENGNDLNFALEKVLDDQSGYYLIGYKPSGKTFANDAYRRFHRIKVEVKRPGLKVRSRIGFFGATDDEMRPRYETALEQLRAAMLSPFRSFGVRVRLTSLYYRDPKRGPVLRNLLHIDAHDLRFDFAGDGSPQAHVDIVAVASGADGQPLAREARSYVFQPKDGRMQEAMEQGMIYELAIPLKQGGLYCIQAAVRDAVTEKVGSASQFLDVPDAKKSRIALTSILLEDGARPRGSPEFDPVVAVRRQFRPGSRIQFACMLEKGPKAKTQTGLRAELRVMRDTRQIYGMAVPLASIASGDFALTGTFRLSDRMPPGDYYVQLVVADLSKKGAVAQRWTDFEVLPAP